MARIVLAMSGGVDSSVAAHLLTAAGHDVIGLFMRHGEPVETACADTNTSPKRERGGPTSAMALPVLTARADHKQGCCSSSDAADARRVADQLDIPFYAVNFSDEFGRIIEYFVDEYRQARTPNPCVVCNNWLKFGRLFEYADSVGAEFVATGHYARIDRSRPPSALPLPPGEGRGEGAAQKTSFVGHPHPNPLPKGEGIALRRGLDGTKDQSYVLFGVARHFLSRMLLPIGGYRKEEIRGLARQLDLRVADKRDSQEICFVASGDHAEFVRRRGGPHDTSGQIVTTSGEVVGRHEGLEQFTIGQRKGLGVAFGEPRYVVRLEAETRRVVIGTHEELARTTFTAERINWLIDEPTEPFRCDVQIRYKSRATSALVEPLDANRLRVTFDEPQFGIAPGQAAVCYEGDRVLGGGWIE